MIWWDKKALGGFDSFILKLTVYTLFIHKIKFQNCWTLISVKTVFKIFVIIISWFLLAIKMNFICIRHKYWYYFDIPRLIYNIIFCFWISVISLWCKKRLEGYNKVKYEPKINTQAIRANKCLFWDKFINDFSDLNSFKFLI